MFLFHRGQRDLEATLVNYKKHGRRFVDHIRIGPIYDMSGKLMNLVGVVPYHNRSPYHQVEIKREKETAQVYPAEPSSCV